MLKLLLISLVTSRDPRTGIDHWGGVIIPKTPMDREYPLKDQEKTYNILVGNNMLGSPKKLIGGIAKDLSKTKWPDSGKPMFNVTLMSEPTSKEFKSLSPTLHALKLDYNISDYFDHSGVKPFPLKAHENKLTAELIDRTKENEISQQIIDSKFDIGFSTFLPWENIMMKRFNLPAVKWAAFLPDPPIMVLNN